MFGALARATGGSTVFLDANECPYEPFVGASGLARYPMQQPPELVRAICDWLDLSSRNVTVARGADEGIDCLMRAFCVPALDNIIICPPTFAMYAQSALLQGVDVRKVPLTADFGLDAFWQPRRIPRSSSLLAEQSDGQHHGP